MSKARRLWQRALADLGQWLAVPAVMAGVMAPCALPLDGWRAALPFGLIALVLGGAAAACRRLREEPGEREDSDENLAIAALGLGLGWLVFVIVCALPFHQMATWHSAAAPYREVVDALFESVSGLTTCGMSMAPDPNGLPHTLQLWRSMLQWVGGVGVVVLALTMLGHASDPEALMDGEVGGSTFGEDAGNTAKRIWTYYAGISVAVVIGYLATGMHWWEALNHMMTTVSTGGFSVSSDSFASYGWTARAVACAGMIAGALSFGFHDDLRHRRFGKALKSRQVWTLLLILGLGMGLVGLYSERPWGELLFQWTSAVTTCGLTTAGTLGGWEPVVLVILASAMAVGGCAGSTTGGFKTLRLQRVLRALFRRLSSSAGHHASVGDELLDPEADLDEDERETLVRMLKAGNFVVLYLGSWLLTMLALSLAVNDQYDLGPLLFDSASALSAVGLSAGMVSPEMPAAGKWVLEVAMWVGRLEVVGGLALFFALYRSFVVGARSGDDA